MEIKDGLKIKVTASFEVDENTVQTCINLLGIHARSKGLEGLVMKIHDDGVEVEQVVDKFVINELMETARKF